VDELKISQFDVLGISSGAPYSYAIGYKLPVKAQDIANTFERSIYSIEGSGHR
jgi:hypothetical protein